MNEDNPREGEVLNLESEKDKKTIFRKAHNRENPYAMISKSVLKDRRLSAKAMGIMCYLLGLPDNWEINLTQLSKNFSDGEKSIKSGIRELILVGYIEKTQTRSAHGYFAGTVMLVHEDPTENFEGLDTPRVSPQAQKRLAVKRPAENGIQLNTKINKNKQVQNNNNKSVKRNKTNKDLSVVVSLIPMLEGLSLSQTLLTTWVDQYGIDYVNEKIALMRASNPNNPEGYLNHAIANDWRPAAPKSDRSPTVAPEPQYPTHAENAVWYQSLPDDEKLRYYQMAVARYAVFETHLTQQKLSVLDANFVTNTFFKMLMGLIGRAP